MTKSKLPNFKELEKRITDPVCLKNMLMDDIEQLYSKLPTPKAFFESPERRDYQTLCSIIDELQQIRILIGRNNDISNNLYQNIVETNDKKAKLGGEKVWADFRRQLVGNLNLSYPGDSPRPEYFSSFRYLLISTINLLQTGKPYIEETEKKDQQKAYI